ncbi:unnamed protein product, partial [Didymodactylos carnosus]
FNNGNLIYYTSLSSLSYDLPQRLTNEIYLFTTNLCITLFGCLLFSGTIVIITMIIVFSIWIIHVTQGDKNGILICLMIFSLCVLMIIIISQKFNHFTVQMEIAKGKLRSFLQVSN